MEGLSERLSRRRFLTTSGYALVGSLGLPALAGPALGKVPSVVQLSDAHVHLFNLADLPARGFFEHAVMWNTDLDIWLVRPMWPAMLDMIAFLKSRSITAGEELASYSYNPDPPEDVGKPEFETMANLRISNMARQSRLYDGIHRVAVPGSLSAAQQRLRDSYYQLAVWFAYFGHPVWRRREPDEAADTACLSDADVDRIRRGARRLHERSCPEAPSVTSNSGIRGTITNTFAWARMLMQSRQYHLKVYRDRIRDGDLRPRTIINLLVDYDEWLDDGPAPGSEAGAQIELWARIRSDYGRPTNPQPIDIRTFAGFDPLKDGLERRGWRRPGEPAQGTTFERNCALEREGKIHGFKLYPPMGFRPIGNDSSMFRSNRRSLRAVRARLAECRIGWEELPELLNRSLTEFYGFCGVRGIPILAHAMHSNEASLCSGVRAGPSGWADVIRAHRDLRICLGHFAEGGDFVDAAGRRRAGHSVHRRNWPFHGTDDLLRQNGPGRSEVFVDLSCMSEFLHKQHGLERAIDFFRELKGYCDRNDGGCRHIMFGTDWIMLEREAANQDYVSHIRGAMAAAEWPEDWQRNLLHDNLQRFLDPAWRPDRR